MSPDGAGRDGQYGRLRSDPAGRPASRALDRAALDAVRQWALETHTLPAAVADCRKALQILGGDSKVAATCQQLELDQRFEEIRKQQEILAEPGRERARTVMAIMATQVGVNFGCLAST